MVIERLPNVVILEHPEMQKLPVLIRNKLKSFLFTEIPSSKFFSPSGDPKPDWQVFYTTSMNARWVAAWDVARNAAADAIWAASMEADRNNALNIARDAAWGAAWTFAWARAQKVIGPNATEAVILTARNAARNLSRDAALMSDYAIVSDLEFNNMPKHMNYVKSRWDIWQSGYGVLCDINGIFHIYKLQDLQKQL